MSPTSHACACTRHLLSGGACRGSLENGQIFFLKDKTKTGIFFFFFFQKVDKKCLCTGTGSDALLCVNVGMKTQTPSLIQLILEFFFLRSKINIPDTTSLLFNTKHIF